MVKGGVCSPSELSHILDLAESMGLDYIHLGKRQDVLIPKFGKINNLDQFPNLQIETSADPIHQNIISSYVSSDIFPSRYWLNGAVYLNILEQFRNKKDIQINLVDPLQSLVPLFSGNLNFIAAHEEDYWYLYIKLNHWNKHQLYPVLIYTWDIGKLAYFIESECLEYDYTAQIFDTVNELYDSRNNIAIREQLAIRFHPFPYYEGLNRITEGQYWLGLYWRNNQYDIPFLRKVVELCQQTNIGKICITPWKSLIIKPIKLADKLMWEKVLGINGINVRHSLLEMNWHIPVNNRKALALKNLIVDAFNKKDISTYGLTFGLFYPQDDFFTSIVIIMDENTNFNTTVYSVLYAKNFAPNTLEYITYAQNVEANDLANLLHELSKKYFMQLGEHDEVVKYEPQRQVPKTDLPPTYQCTECLSLYDDALEEIPFDKLPPTYTCSLCEAPKSEFETYEKAFV